MAHKPRAGAVRKKKKGATVGTGGHGRQALEGRGPTPKAEDRPYHPKGKAKAAAERKAAKQQGASKPATQRSGSQPKKDADAEIVTGRNSVVESLRAKVPSSVLYVATRITPDDRVRESITIASSRGIPIMEVTRTDLDRLAGEDSVHQGIALQVPPYQYRHPMDVLDDILDRDQVPLIVMLDGITDPRNLGAIIRSVAAFGGHAVVIPQRRSAGVTASAWKTSAGAALRVPVALASNLTQTLKEYKKRGLFVIGLDGGGDVMLPDLSLSDRPLVVVVGSEGKGLSRLVQENCDQVVSIPIESSTESLNAGIAASVALYAVSQQRNAAGIN